MPEGSTEKFLRLMEEQNVRVARVEAMRSKQEPVDIDSTRLQRDEERREKYGQLRAEPRPGKRRQKNTGNLNTDAS